MIRWCQASWSMHFPTLIKHSRLLLHGRQDGVKYFLSHRILLHNGIQLKGTIGVGILLVKFRPRQLFQQRLLLLQISNPPQTGLKFEQLIICRSMVCCAYIRGINAYNTPPSLPTGNATPTSKSCLSCSKLRMIAVPTSISEYRTNTLIALHTYHTGQSKAKLVSWPASWQFLYDREFHLIITVGQGTLLDNYCRTGNFIW